MQGTDQELFQQQNYYFLFDKDMEFSKRQGFSLEKELTAEDYTKMRSINRQNLCKFLEKIKNNADAMRVIQHKGDDDSGVDPMIDQSMSGSSEFLSASPNKQLSQASKNLSQVSNISPFKQKQCRRFPVVERKSFVSSNSGTIKDMEID